VSPLLVSPPLEIELPEGFIVVSLALVDVEPKLPELGDDAVPAADESELIGDVEPVIAGLERVGEEYDGVANVLGEPLSVAGTPL
jgi:hypothetical protein